MDELLILNGIDPEEQKEKRGEKAAADNWAALRTIGKG